MTTSTTTFNAVSYGALSFSNIVVTETDTGPASTIAAFNQNYGSFFGSPDPNGAVLGWGGGLRGRLRRGGRFAGAELYVPSQRRAGQRDLLYRAVLLR